MTTTKNNEHKKLNFSSEREQSQVCLNSAEHEKNQGRKVLNVPNLRFPEFQGEWKKCKLEELSNKITRKNKGNAIQNVLSNSATLGLIPQNEYFDREIANSNNTDSYYVIEYGDFVYNPRKSVSAPYGPVNIYTGNIKGIISPLYLCFSVHSILPSFLYYRFKSPAWFPYVYSHGDTGTRFDRVSIKDDVFFGMPIYMPSQKEQKKISHLMSLLDKRIATQNKIIDKLQSLIKGIAQHCIRDFTNGCEYVRLGDICKITTGKLDANAQVENGQYPFFTCAERPFNIDNYAFDTEALLISGNGANLGYINYYKGKFNAYQRTYVLDYFSVNIQYVKWALKVLLPQRIAIEKSSSNTPYIVLSTLADLKIPIPNNSKQNHIADLMMSFERKLSTQLALSDLYNKQKQYLLRQMFI